jgi:hypothetical protein
MRLEITSPRRLCLLLRLPWGVLTIVVLAERFCTEWLADDLWLLASAGLLVVAVANAQIQIAPIAPDTRLAARLAVLVKVFNKAVISMGSNQGAMKTQLRQK